MTIAKKRNTPSPYTVRRRDAQDMGIVYSEERTVNRGDQRKNVLRSALRPASPFRLPLLPLFWRLATLAFPLPLPLPSLTSEFGMGSGVTSAVSHQNKKNNLLVENEERHPTHARRVSGKKNQQRKRSRDSHNSFREFCWIISTPWLNALLHFHRAPINVVISHDP